MPYIPTELLYLLAAIVVGALLYRYFTGHGGIEIRREDYQGLPDEGHIQARKHVVRWRAAEGDSLVAAWQLESGHFVVMRVVFDDVDEEDPDLGYIDVDIDKRTAVSGASWTDKVRDRSLRGDVEGILRMLQREAKVARSDKTRVAGARIVGDYRPDERSEGDPTD
jgi:hypothetical protein